MFGKYQLCRVLGTGQHGTVFLAIHKELNEYRAIKRVPKASLEYDIFRQEALTLKELRHPGIPIIYDLEDDETYSYLIEEFLEGDSLYARINQEGHMSRAMTIDYGIQICRLVQYLHFAKPYPILFLDLQPKNLLLCHEIVKLVDFEHAMRAGTIIPETNRYGTPGCAAPEQYTDEVLDERTDIYAIGAVLYFMLSAALPDKTPVYPEALFDRQMREIISTCLQANREERYSTVTELCCKLEELENQLKKEISSLKIIVAGSARGVGATHIAIGLAAYLKKNGISCLYEEHNETGAVRKMADALGISADSCGIYQILNQAFRPQYGEAIRLKSHSYKVVILDYGEHIDRIMSDTSDLIWVVCGSKWWEQDANALFFSTIKKLPGLTVLFNHVCRQMRITLPVQIRKEQCILMPYFENPFFVSEEAMTCYKQLLKNFMTEKGVVKSRNHGIWVRLKEIKNRIGGPQGS